MVGYLAQIELRGLALKDIQAIRRTLRPPTRCQKEHRRLQDSLFGSIASSVPDVYGGQLERIINYQKDPAPGLKLSFDLLAT